MIVYFLINDTLYTVFHHHHHLMPLTKHQLRGDFFCLILLLIAPFCFFQRKSEWVGLADKHPDLFKQAVAIEQKVMNDGKSSFEDQAMKERQYSWSPGETLPELLNRRSEIEEKHKKALLKAKSSRKNLPLVDVLSEALDDDDDEKPCTMCHL